MVHHAINEGVNYIDTAYPYHGNDFSKGGSSETFLARALKNGYREKVHLATKLPTWLVHSRQDMDRYLEEQLKRLDTDCIDFYLLHALKRSIWDELVRNNVYDFMEDAVRAGKIRYAGFSFHDEINQFKKIVDDYNWTFCQIQYNYVDEDFQAGSEGLQYATDRDIAVVIMEPLRGGSLVNELPPEALEVFREAAPGRSQVGWALGWLWNQPGVTIVISGMSHMDHVKENLALAKSVPAISWTEKDEDAIRKVISIVNDLQKVNCTYCAYCLPCPEGVNIPRNLTLLNDHYVFHDPTAKQRYYGIFSDQERASNCTSCGECLEKCPQNIPIPDELKHLADLFKK